MKKEPKKQPKKQPKKEPTKPKENTRKKYSTLKETKKELTDEEIKEIIFKYKKENNIRKSFPIIYFKGYSKKTDVIKRLDEFMQNEKNNYQYDKIKFQTDKIRNLPIKPSKYTNLFIERFIGKDKKLSSTEMSDEFKSKLTGVPLDIIKQVKNKGFGAYYTGGHRPGVSPQAWANARVNSFLTLGCAALSADEHLLQEVYKMRVSKSRKKFFNQPISCDKKKFKIPFYLEKKNNKYMKN